MILRLRVLVSTDIHTCDHMQVNSREKLIWLQHLDLKYSPVQFFILLHILMNLTFYSTI